MRIVICDDQKMDIDYTKEQLLKLQPVLHSKMEIFELMDGDTMLHDIIKEKIEIVLLDIDMPQITGIELAEQLIKEIPMIKIIFLTNRADLVFQTIRFRPYRFIRKSHMEEELKETITSLEVKLLEEEYVFEFSKSKNVFACKIKDILYIESQKHYLVIHTNQRCHKIRGKISDYEERLVTYGFIRVNIAYLVNVRYIYSVSSKYVIMDNGENISISRGKAEQVKREYLIGLERFVNGNTI